MHKQLQLIHAHVTDIASMANRVILLALMFSLFTACASRPNSEEYDKRDPLEKVNRVMWDLNYKVLDKNIVKPAAKGYEKLGRPVRKSVSNFVFNLEEPLNAVNNILQGKFKDSGTNVGRFAINSTIGLLGLFDVAQKWNLNPKREDFGQTLGSWGIGNGGYLMLPIYGATTPRNFVGDVLDTVVYPVSLLNSGQLVLNFALKGLERRVQLFDQDPVIAQSVDSYNFVKEIYFQNDAFKVTGQRPEDNTEDDDLLFDDEELLIEDDASLELEEP